MRIQSEGLIVASLEAVAEGVQALSNEFEGNLRRNEEIWTSIEEHKAAINSLLALVRLPEADLAKYRALATKPPPEISKKANDIVKHGTVTRAVVALLEPSEAGLTAREIIERVQASDFKVKSPETAVRSALKNLRGRNVVEYDGPTGRYRTKPASKQ